MRPIDADELYSRLMTRYEAHNLDDTRDMAARAAIMSCMEGVERSKTITISQPPNNPLTLDELREMDGEPVWCDRWGVWGLVDIGFSAVITRKGDLDINDEGIHEMIYRRKLEEDT